MITQDQVLNEQEINQVAGGSNTPSIQNVKPISCVLGDSPSAINKQKTGDSYWRLYADWHAAA